MKHDMVALKDLLLFKKNIRTKFIDIPDILTVLNYKCSLDIPNRVRHYFKEEHYYDLQTTSNKVIAKVNTWICLYGNSIINTCY